MARLKSRSLLGNLEVKVKDKSTAGSNGPILGINDDIATMEEIADITEISLDEVRTMQAGQSA